MDFTQLLAKLSVLEGKADEPAAPDSDAVARRKRLDALRDKQEEREEGEGTKSNKRFVAGKAYGGANQKDDEDLEESKEECNQSAEGKECPVHGMEECSGYMEEGVAEGGRTMTGSARDKFISTMSPRMDNNALMQKVGKVVNSPEFNSNTILKIVDSPNITHPVGLYIQKEFDELQYDLGRAYEDHPEEVAEKLLSMLQDRTQQGVAEGLGTSPDKLLARTGMNNAHKFPRKGQTNLGNIPAMNTPGNSPETDAYAEKRRGDRKKELKPAIKAALGTHGPKGKLPEQGGRSKNDKRYLDKFDPTEVMNISDDPGMKAHKTTGKGSLRTSKEDLEFAFGPAGEDDTWVLEFGNGLIATIYPQSNSGGMDWIIGGNHPDTEDFVHMAYSAALDDELEEGENWSKHNNKRVGGEVDEAIHTGAALQKYRDNRFAPQNEPAKPAPEQGVVEGAKPDFLDMDKDGDKKEPMKKAVKDKEDDKELEECYDGSTSAMGSEDQNSGMNINTSIDTHTGRKTLSVTADGEAAEELMQMLKLSGIGGQGAQAEAPDAVQAVQPQGQPSMADHIKVVSVPLAHQEGGFKMGGEEEVEEEYSNEPDPQVQPVDVQLHQGNDLNREKKMTKHGYQQGDNPLAMREAEELAALEKSLFEELASIKVAPRNKTGKK